MCLLGFGIHSESLLIVFIIVLKLLLRLRLSMSVDKSSHFYTCTSRILCKIKVEPYLVSYYAQNALAYGLLKTPNPFLSQDSGKGIVNLEHPLAEHPARRGH